MVFVSSGSGRRVCRDADSSFTSLSAMPKSLIRPETPMHLSVGWMSLRAMELGMNPTLSVSRAAHRFCTRGAWKWKETVLLLKI